MGSRKPQWSQWFQQQQSQQSLFLLLPRCRPSQWWFQLKQQWW
jgi:hypothetical protein